MTAQEIANFEIEVLGLLKNVMDPEIEINIVDLGLIYELDFDGNNTIDIDLTFSTPSCPLGDTIVTNIKAVIEQNYPHISTNVNIVFEPRWTANLISKEGKRILGM